MEEPPRKAVRYECGVGKWFYRVRPQVVEHGVRGKDHFVKLNKYREVGRNMVC